MMLKKNLMHQIMKSIYHYLLERIKVIGIMKDELERKIMAEFVVFRPKT